MSGQTDGKLCPEVETDRRPISRFAVVLSVLSVVLALAILCFILGWFWEPRSHLQSDLQVLAGDPG